MNKTIITAILAALAILPTAQAKSISALTPETVGSNLSPAERQRLKDLGGQISATAQEAARAGMQKYGKKAAAIARRADDIADAALAVDRAEALKLLGIDPDGVAALYYFVSWSMPQEMLRTYALEAMWTGGTLVFKGIPPGKDLKAFITEDLQSLVYGKGSFASISIDPRLYESYGIKVVPTIVLTEDRANPLCLGAKHSFAYGKETLGYLTCPKLAEDKYWKIAGTVTSNYALLEFKAHGAETANAHLAALAKGLAVGISSAKTAAPYTGAWKDAISPADIAAGREAVAKMRQKQRQPRTPPLAPPKKTNQK